jgi:ubiquinone/menaquinone biosynthesis C-methylase UbiE
VDLILKLLRIFFSLLYHQFAWTYDLVAATVSLGRWKKWVKSTLPYLDGRVLEIGYGPGHLQAVLGEKSLSAFGVDESRQMARQAERRLKKKGLQARLTRGLSQHLPFRSNAFDAVVATFPSEYIYDPHTLEEAQRVLVPDGRFILVPMAWITGRRPADRLAAWLFRLTGEAPGEPRPLPAAVRERFMKAGFQVESELIEVEGSQVLLILATAVRSP